MPPGEEPIGTAIRILYVIDSLVAGGAERSLATLAPRYAALGVSLEIAYLHERPGLHRALEEAGATLHPLAGSGGRLGWIRRAARLVTRHRPDLVHTTLFEADLAGRVAGAVARVPVVSSLVNVAYGPEMLRNPQLRPWKVRAAQAADVATARLVRRFHAVSGPVADAMARRLLVSRQRIDVVPRGRDPQELGRRTPDRAAQVRAALGLPPGAAVVLAVGRQERQKGLDLALEALGLVRREVPAARLIVAGREGNQTAALHGAARRLGMEEAVTFLGARDDVADLLCAADVFVFPSRWEGMPGSVLEAMALEAPIVASDIPSVREIVDGEIAVLVPPEDPQALAGAVARVLADTGPAAARARLARGRFLERFTVDRTAEEMVRFYERALRHG